MDLVFEGLLPAGLQQVRPDWDFSAVTVHSDPPSTTLTVHSPVVTGAQIRTAVEQAQAWEVAEEARRQRERGAAAAKSMILARQALAEARRLVEEAELSEEEAEQLAPLFQEWAPGQALIVGDIREYEGGIYVCIQAHTSQSDWTPPLVPALFNRYTAPGQVAAWVQPAGAHDAYSIGARVTHNGSTWESTHADNVWEPGVFGWTEV